jgi:hypothetical protein
VHGLLHFSEEPALQGGGVRVSLADSLCWGRGAASKYVATPLAAVTGPETPDSQHCIVDSVHGALAYATWKAARASHASNGAGDVSLEGIVASVQAYRF